MANLSLVLLGLTQTLIGYLGNAVMQSLQGRQAKTQAVEKQYKPQCVLEILASGWVLHCWEGFKNQDFYCIYIQVYNAVAEAVSICKATGSPYRSLSVI